MSSRFSVRTPQRALWHCAVQGMLTNTHSIEQQQRTVQSHAQNSPTQQRLLQCKRDYNIGARLLRNMGWGADTDFLPLPLGTPPPKKHEGWSQPGIGHPERRSAQHRQQANDGRINTAQPSTQDTTQHAPIAEVTVTKGNICSMLGIPLDAVCSVIDLQTDTDKTDDTIPTLPQPTNTPAATAPGTREHDAAIYAFFNEATRASIIRLQE
jgi:hypothetical protein